MDDLDLEKLKHELDGVYDGGRYNVDDILREAGIDPEDSGYHGTDLEHLMKKMGVPIGEAAAEQPAKSSDWEESDDLSALFLAVEETQEMTKQQNFRPEDDYTESQPKTADMLSEQEDVFANLFAQISEIEQQSEEETKVLDELRKETEKAEADTADTADTELLEAEEVVDEVEAEEAAAQAAEQVADEEPQPVTETEEQPKPESSNKPKKGFFARLFGISDIDEDMVDENTQEIILPDMLSEQEDIQPELEPVSEMEPESSDETAAIETNGEESDVVDEVPQEESGSTEEEDSEPSRPKDGPLISEEELQEFLSSVSEETSAQHTSFEQLLRDNGVDLEKPIKSSMTRNNSDSEDFPDKETTLYVDIPLRSQEARPGQIELFDVDMALAADEQEKMEKDDEEPEWLHMSLEQICDQAPPLEELRQEGPVMAREVARQKEWLLERRRAYLESVKGGQAEPSSEKPAEQPEEEADVIHAGDELQAMREQQNDEQQEAPEQQSDEERGSVFTSRSADKPETEPADRKNELTDDETSLEDTQEIEKIQFDEPTSQKKRKVWPQEEIPQDLRRASGIWRRRARGQARRSVFVGVFALIAIYISCAADFSLLPLPVLLDYSFNPSNVLMVLLVLQFAAMLAAYDIVFEGIQAALHLTPNFSTLVDLALILNIIHCIVRMVSEGEEVPYACIALLALFVQMRAKFSFSCTRHYIFKATANVSQPMGIFYHESKKPHLVKAPLKSMSRFIEQVVQPDENWKQERIITVLAIILAAVMSAIVCTATGDTGRLPYVLAATVTGACQIALLSASEMGHKNAVHYMVKNGAAADGRRGARKLASANAVILTDEDLFPNGSITLQEMELRGSLSDATSLAYAAALTEGCSLGNMLAEEVRTRYGAPLTASHIVRYVGGGISGRVGGLEILLGSENFVKDRSVTVSDVPENALVLAVDGSAAAVFVISYHVPAALLNAMQVITERHMTVMLHTRNEQVTPKMAERLYGLRTDSIKLMRGEQDRAVKSPRYTENDTLCGILIRDGLVPLSDCISTAQAQTRLSWLGMGIGIGAAIICMLLMMYMCYIFVPADARPIRMLIYTVLCFVPIFFIENGVGRS